MTTRNLACGRPRSCGACGSSVSPRRQSSHATSACDAATARPSDKRADAASNARRFRSAGIHTITARTKPTMSLTAFMVSAGDLARAFRAVRQHRVDMAGSCTSRFISARDRTELGDREIDQRRLEGGELRAAEFAQHLGRASCPPAPHRCRRDFPPPAAPSSPFSSLGSGSGSVLALRIFCAIASASSVRLMRE